MFDIYIFIDMCFGLSYVYHKNNIIIINNYCIAIRNNCKLLQIKFSNFVIITYLYQ